MGKRETFIFYFLSMNCFLKSSFARVSFFSHVYETCGLRLCFLFNIIYFVFFFSFTSSQAFALEDINEKQIIKRVYSHLLIGDYRNALRECEKAFSRKYTSKELKEAYVRSLVESRRDEEAIAFWKKTKEKKPSLNMLETLAWGILRRSETSSQLIVNSISLIGAFTTRDARAVKMLQNQMHSSDALLRAMAAQFASHYRDRVLIEELKRLFKEERVWFVRLEVIRSLGEMEIEEMKEPFKKIIACSENSFEEKIMSMHALALLYHQVDLNELKKLCKSKRFGLRYLASEIIAHHEILEGLPLVIELLDDACPDVRIGALNTLYMLGIKHLSLDTLKKIEEMTKENHPGISITASWLILPFFPNTALDCLKNWVFGSDEKSRYLAALILGNSGEVGRRLAKEAMHISPDPFVKANIALGLIRSGIEVKLSCYHLYQFLMLYQEKIMWDKVLNPFFEVLSPSHVYHIPQTPQYPTQVDQFTRLDILNLLMIFHHPKSKKALKSFLKHHIFGISFAASKVLLEGGMKKDFELLRSLLEDKDQMIRIQAAFVLALSGSDPDAIQVLEKAYFEMDREKKIAILEAIGHIGNPKSIPFLVERLDEPHQVLRVIIASTLIQCLYH